MNRRSALKQAALIMGGIAFIPSCSFDSERVSIALKNLNIKARHEKLLTEIVETIIPATDIPGAKDLNVHEFVLVMVDDCLDKGNQDIFVKGLDQFENFTGQRYGKSFSKGTQAEREEMLRHIEEQEESGETTAFNQQEIKAFLDRTRQFTIQGYMSSEYVMTEVVPYQLVPGHFKGCVPVEQAKAI